MKASSTISGEIKIELDSKEISDLEKKTLQSSVSIRDTIKGKSSEIFSKKKLRIKLGNTNNKIINLIHCPTKSNFLKSNAYLIVLSKEAYSSLKNTGYVGERFNHGFRVDFYKTKFLSSAEKF